MTTKNNTQTTIYIAIIAILVLFLSTPVGAGKKHSQCYGTTAKGHLVNGKQLPADGTNYTNYSSIGRGLGRTYVHSEVRAIVIDAFRQLEKEQPDKRYKYAETGFEEGGLFKPHKTHQNGLSIDFMVPVLDSQGSSVELPTDPFNKFGYDIEFSKDGKYKDLQIDFDALAAHIVALNQSAIKNGHGLWRVIFAPELQPFLLKTKYGEYIKKNIQLSKKRSWVRHDEHYHVDFDIACKPYGSYKK